jgi:hypothetical protein
MADSLQRGHPSLTHWMINQSSRQIMTRQYQSVLSFISIACSVISIHTILPLDFSAAFPSPPSPLLSSFSLLPTFPPDHPPPSDCSLFPCADQSCKMPKPSLARAGASGDLIDRLARSSHPHSWDCWSCAPPYRRRDGVEAGAGG